MSISGTPRHPSSAEGALPRLGSPPRRPPVVAKVGGRELRSGQGLEDFVAWAAETVREGTPLVIVHGGGEEVSDLAERLGIPTLKVEGQRVTTPEVLPVVEGVLAGPVNLRLVSALNLAGVRAVGLTGVSAGCVVAHDVKNGVLGLVGEPSEVDPQLVRDLHRVWKVPVFAPLASDGRGGVLNVNADLFASGLAEALGGDLVLFTDVPGVLGPQGEVLARLTPARARDLIEERTVHGGMVPKVEAALRVLEQGAHGVWIGALPPRGSRSLSGGTWFRAEQRAPRSAPASTASGLPQLPPQGPPFSPRRPPSPGPGSPGPSSPSSPSSPASPSSSRRSASRGRSAPGPDDLTLLRTLTGSRGT